MENYTYEETIKTPEPKKRRGKTALKVAALALGCSLLGGAVGAGGTALTGFALYTVNKQVAVEDTNTTTMYEGIKENPALNVSYIDTSKEMSASEIYAKNVNSTVGITTSITTNYFGYQTTTPAAGSGFILTEDGYIVTNYHVIEDASEIKVTTYDNDEYEAKLIGYDMQKLRLPADGTYSDQTAPDGQMVLAVDFDANLQLYLKTIHEKPQPDSTEAGEGTT